MILIFQKNLQNQKNQWKKKRHALTLKNAIILLNGRQKVLNTFKSELFPKKKQGGEVTSISDHVLWVAKVPNTKVFNH